MNKIWAYFLTGFGLLASGVFFIFNVFKAGKRAERFNRNQASLKKKEKNKKIFKKLEVEYEDISAADVANRLNKLR